MHHNGLTGTPQDLSPGVMVRYALWTANSSPAARAPKPLFQTASCLRTYVTPSSPNTLEVAVVRFQPATDDLSDFYRAFVDTQRNRRGVSSPREPS